ncbi:MAG: hypothetical protein AAF412_10965 [Pseudomonadota bacterium]
MKFGEIAVGEAEGAILAHSMKLADGTVIKKGVMLTLFKSMTVCRSLHINVASQHDFALNMPCTAYHVTTDTLQGEDANILHTNIENTLFALEDGHDYITATLISHSSMNGIAWLKSESCFYGTKFILKQKAKILYVHFHIDWLCIL